MLDGVGRELLSRSGWLEGVFEGSLEVSDLGSG